MPDLYSCFASIADRIDRHDLRDRYLDAAESFAGMVTTWGFEETVDKIGRSLRANVRRGAGQYGGERQFHERIADVDQKIIGR